MPRPGVHIVVKKTTKTPFYEILFWHEVTNIAGEIKEYKCIFLFPDFLLKAQRETHWQFTRQGLGAWWASFDKVVEII